MQKITSRISFSYKTVKVTQSRINKGLLAIPVSLVDYFPKQKREIYMISGTSNKVSTKTFTPYSSSSRECRIGGMRNFYETHNFKDGDELVLQILDTGKYRIMTENQLEEMVRELEREFDQSKDEAVADSKLGAIAKLVNADPKETLWGEYSRLARTEIKPRKRKIISPRQAREAVPPSIRKLLTKVYYGKCQLTGFGFLMKNGRPYFEVHHIKSELGNHIKNILVVSSNIHAQFTHALVKEKFDDDGWLRQVKFNNRIFAVKHIIDKIPKEFKKEVYSET